MEPRPAFKTQALLSRPFQVSGGMDELHFEAALRTQLDDLGESRIEARPRRLLPILAAAFADDAFPTELAGATRCHARWRFLSADALAILTRHTFNGSLPMHIPTPEEILAACITIQAGWTLDQRDSRVANDHWRTRHFVPPTVHVPRRSRETPDRD